MSNKPDIFYVMDPMCSWCWGFAETFHQFQQQLGDRVNWHYVMGGLAADSDEVMPATMAQTIQSHWHAVNKRSGAPFNFDFWTACSPRRSTYPACRAVIAAGLQGHDYKSAMIDAIQKAYYTQAQNPSDQGTLIHLAQQIGLDPAPFEHDIGSNKVQGLFQSDLDRCRAWNVSGFPSLIYSSQHKPETLNNGFTDLESLMQRWQQLQG